MGQTLAGALGPGLALAGVLAVAGVAAARTGHRWPHLGVAAIGAGVAAGAGRLATLPPAAVVALLLGAGGALGLAAFVADRRTRAIPAAAWPAPLLPDVAVLGLGLAVTVLVRPPLAVELPLGPLGGVVPGGTGALVLGIGVAGALLVATVPFEPRGLVVWALCGAFTAVAVAIGSGAVLWSVPGIPPVLAVPDAAGLAVRAVAVGLVARWNIAGGLVAAAVLGVGEMVLRAAPVLGALATVPVIVVLAFGVAARARTRPPTLVSSGAP